MRHWLGCVAALAAGVVIGACSLTAPSDLLLAGESGECELGTKRCDGVCVSTDSPAVGCASIGCEPCSMAHAEPVCAAGACAVGQCAQGWDDCDGDADNGCEAPRPSGAANCDCHAVELPTPAAVVDLKGLEGLGVGSGAFTLEVWLLLESKEDTGGRRKYVFRMETEGDPDPTSTLELSLDQGFKIDCLATAVATDYGRARSDDPIQAGRWYHAACTRSGGRLVLYVNGQEQGVSTAATHVIEEPTRARLGGLWGVEGRHGVLHVGPVRFSAIGRYQSNFLPYGHWVDDEHTVLQYLVTEPLDVHELSGTLSDETGKGHDGVATPDCRVSVLSPCDGG